MSESSQKYCVTNANEREREREDAVKEAMLLSLISREREVHYLDSWTKHEKMLKTKFHNFKRTSH